MRPLTLTIENLRSFRAKRKVDFGDLSLYAIIGDTGAGKTSILEAITYALYNRSTWNGRNVKELISKGANAMSVVFTFDVDGDEFTIVRMTRRIGSVQHRLTCPARGIDVSGEGAVGQAVRDAVRLDDEAFLHTVLLPQGKHAELLTANDGTRNKILAEIFRLDELAEVGNLAKFQEGRADTGLSALRRERGALGDSLAETVDAAAGQIQAADGRLATARAAEVRVAVLDEAITSANRRIEALQGRLARLEGVPELLRTLRDLDAVAADLDIRIQAVRRAEAEARDTYDQARSAVDALHAEKLDAESIQGYRVLLEACSADLRERKREQLQLQQAVARRAEAHQRAGLAAESKQIADAESELARAEAARAEQLAESERPKLMRLEAAIGDWKRPERADAELQSILERQRTDLAELDLKKARATSAAKAAQEDLRSAEAALAKARVEAGAATVAAHLHAGDECPICKRALPAGFTAPTDKSLHTAQEHEKASKAALVKASQAQLRLEAQTDAARQGEAETVAKLAQARTEMEAARAVLTGLLPKPDADPRTVLAEMVERVRVADSSLSKLRERRDAAEAQARRAATAEAAASSELAGLDRSIEALDRSIELRSRTYADRLTELPQSFRPAADDENGVKEAMRTVTAALNTAMAAVTAVGKAGDGIQVAAAEAARVAHEHTTRVVAPRSAALGKLDEIATFLGLAKLPTSESERAAWIDTIRGIANREVDGARSEIATSTTSRESARAERAAIVTELGAEPKVAVTEAALTKRDAERELRSAREALERARSLDKRIIELEPVHLGLQTLREELGSRRFPAYATEQRQRRLLEIGSTILMEMTQNRYGFTKEFEIFDQLSNEARGPQTLSGGEKFLASLALSLAVVEIAASAGAKIGSLFLDEGFASLDSESLQMAMLELRRQARRNRSICVISHLSEVTQFVDNTFRVEATADGTDVKSIAGPIDDESALVEGLVSQLR